MKVIKIDCDGVLRDLLPQMCDLYNKNFDEHIEPENVLEYDLNNTFTKCNDIDGMTPNKWFFTEHITDVYIKSKPFDGAKEAIDILHNKGYYIIIVTAQPKIWQQNATLSWLELNNIYYDSICFTDKKDLINGDIIVDDNVDNLRMCNENIKILITAPYNKKEIEFKRFDSLYNFVNAI